MEARYRNALSLSVVLIMCVHGMEVVSPGQFAGEYQSRHVWSRSPSVIRHEPISASLAKAQPFQACGYGALDNAEATRGKVAWIDGGDIPFEDCNKVNRIKRAALSGAVAVVFSESQWTAPNVKRKSWKTYNANIIIPAFVVEASPFYKLAGGLEINSTWTNAQWGDTCNETVIVHLPAPERDEQHVWTIWANSWSAYLATITTGLFIESLLALVVMWQQYRRHNTMKTVQFAICAMVFVYVFRHGLQRSIDYNGKTNAIITPLGEELISISAYFLACALFSLMTWFWMNIYADSGMRGAVGQKALKAFKFTLGIIFAFCILAYVVAMWYTVYKKTIGTDPTLRSIEEVAFFIFYGVLIGLALFCAYFGVRIVIQLSVFLRNGGLSKTFGDQRIRLLAKVTFFTSCYTLLTFMLLVFQLLEEERADIGDTTYVSNDLYFEWAFKLIELLLMLSILCAFVQPPHKSRRQRGATKSATGVSTGSASGGSMDDSSAVKSESGSVSASTSVAV